MKVLLVMPSFDNGYWKKLGKKVGPKSEPLNLVYIATYLNSNGHNARIMDCEAEGLSIDDIKGVLSKEKFDVVGIAMLTLMYSYVKEICAVIKRINPETKVVLGGSHPTIRPVQTLTDIKDADIAIIGEAELTFLDLLNAFENKKLLSKVNGIAYRNTANHIKTTPKRELIQNLDILPIPDRSLLKMNLYRPSVSYYKKLPAHIILSSRGCPYRCVFCSKVFEKTYRIHSTDRVIAEMENLINKFHAKEIVFRDDTFTLKEDWINELCQKIIEKKINKKIRWSCMTRVNLVNPQMLKLMKKAGCWGIHYGVESGVQRLLDVIKKDITVEQIKNAFRWTKGARMETRGFFMLGLPTETKEESQQTIKFAKELNPDWAQFTITTPYPGTELFEEAGKYGKLSLTWENYQTWGGFSENDVAWVPFGRTSQELKSLQRKALKEFYFRPSVILKKLVQLDNIPIFKKYLLGVFALAAGGSGRQPE